MINAICGGVRVVNKAKETNVIKIKRAYILSLSKGVTRKEAAEAAGVSCYTIWNWAKQDKEFENEINNALESRIKVVEDALLNNAVGRGEYTNKEGKKIIDRGNVIAQIFYLKNRGKGKWKDKQEMEIKVPDVIKVKHFIQAGKEPVIEEEKPKKIEGEETTITFKEVEEEAPKGIETVL